MAKQRPEVKKECRWLLLENGGEGGSHFTPITCVLLGYITITFTAGGSVTLLF